MGISYCSYYKNKNDGKKYIPLVHSDDRTKIICLRIYYDIKNNSNYYNFIDNQYVYFRKLKTIKISDLEGPLINSQGEEISVSYNKRNKLYYGVWMHKISNLENSYNKLYRGESIKFLDWTIYKYILDSGKKISGKILDSKNQIIVKKNCIYWINFGHNIGSEQRKERPAIIWRKFDKQDKYYVIPITSKNKNIPHHIKIENTNMYATIEHMKLVSVKRVNRPYFDKCKKIKKINENDVFNIKETIIKFLSLD